MLGAEYSTGAKLFGDDFNIEQLEEWYRDEAEGYANLGAKEHSQYSYHYHALNKQHLYAHIGNRSYQRAIGLGSAYGDEFLPIANRISEVDLVDPSAAFEKGSVPGVVTRRHKPSTRGELPFEDNAFDLSVCVSTLHHIANVSYLVGEIGRVLKPGAHALFRDPICSMGDWTRPRGGLTKRERGIPLALFKQYLRDANLRIVHEAPCCFGALMRVWPRFIPGGYNESGFVRIDAWLSRVLAFNNHYHRRNIVEKLAPSSWAFVTEKR